MEEETEEFGVPWYASGGTVKKWQILLGISASFMSLALANYSSEVINSLLEEGEIGTLEQKV